jgi:hypothetical protein
VWPQANDGAGNYGQFFLADYNLDMKAYVLDYQPLPEQQTTKMLIRRGEEKPAQYRILFGHRPAWALGEKSVAKAECAILNSLGIQVGQHHCQFEVEEVKIGIFAIVCKGHPGP